MRARSLSALAVPVLFATTLVACTSPDPTPVVGTSTGSAAGGSSFGALLARTPDTAANGSDSVMVVYGDLDRATDAAGLQRPDDAGDADPVMDWILPITGARREGVPAELAVQLPNSVSPQRLSQVTEIQQEVGWSVVDVHQYVEVQAPPQYFMLAAADDLTADLDAAQGAAVEGVWGADGKDFEVSLADSSPARPLGENVRVAQQDGLLAVSRATPPLTQWLSGGATLADDPVLTPIAAALDGAGVYTATIVTGEDFSVIASQGHLARPEIVEALGELDLPLPFTSVGAGLSVVDGTSTGTIVLSFPNDQAATDSLDVFSAGLTDGTSIATGQPMSDLFRLIEARVDGNLIIATVGFQNSVPGTLFKALLQRDLPFVHG